jgi:hypothetical protein
MDHLLYFVPLRPGVSLGCNTAKDQRADRALNDPGSGSSILHVWRLSRAGGPTVRGSGHPSGLVAQLVEHPVCNGVASGSNPDESMGAIPTWTSKERPPNKQNLQPIRPGRLWERLGGPDRHRASPPLEERPAADNGGQSY